MTTFFRLQYKLKGNNEKIAESFYKEGKTRDGSPFFEMDETFLHFKTRTQWDLGMTSRSDWKKVLWKKEEENDSEWKPFLVDEKKGKQGGIHKEHAFFMFY